MGSHLFVISSDWKMIFNEYNFLFWMEWVAAWAFAAAWLTKGRVIVAEIAVSLLSIPREAFAEQIRKL